MVPSGNPRRRVQMLSSASPGWDPPRKTSNPSAIEAAIAASQAMAYCTVVQPDEWLALVEDPPREDPPAEDLPEWRIPASLLRARAHLEHMQGIIRPQPLRGTRVCLAE